MNVRQTILAFCVLFGFSFNSYSQSADLQVEYDEFTQTFTVSLIALDNSFETNVLMGSSQISIVTDTIVNRPNFTNIQTVNPSNGNWSINSEVNSPGASPANDFYAFSTLGGNFTPSTFVAGTKVTLFTFQLSDGCSQGLRLFENATDPTSSDIGMNGGDFSNDLFFIGMTNPYRQNVSPNIVNCDTDGDGVKDVDEVATQNDPCLPAQPQDYTGYVSNNATWMAADCDGDGVNNGTEHANGSDPYDSCDPNPFALPDGCVDYVFLGPLKDGDSVTHCLDTSWITSGPLTVTDCDANASGTLASGSTFELDSLGCLTVKAPADVVTSSADSLCVRICDDTGDCRTTVIKIGITANPPVIEEDSISVGDSSIVCLDTTWTTGGDVTINDCNGMTSGTTPENGTYTIDEDGCVTYKPDPNLDRDIVDTVCVVVCDSSICDTSIITIPVSPVRFVAKVLLQGAMFDGLGPTIMADGLMRDDLRANNYLGDSPYSNTDFYTSAPAVVTAMANAFDDRAENSVVDWIFVQFRSATDSSQVLRSDQLMLQRDGDIVSSDGVSPLVLPISMIGDSFYVSIRHRNHLGVMTKQPVQITDSTTIDFSDINGEYHSEVRTIGGVNYDYSSVVMADVGGRYALWAGDPSRDGKVHQIGDSNRLLAAVASVQDPANILYNYDNALGYFTEDLNLDGKVKYQGATPDAFILTRMIVTYPLNTSQVLNFDHFKEMLPTQK